ncbi:hypothetical protein LSH36_32g14032 [Paralvinella palmiformis]|uniref:Uncharacterized protein n=1 Tax=Paralvinella palmiformis TaxID=53620 RepID=A0AAD9K9P1_9ANNE|nr:hypothetical protein LSH36_32g14032 [Paralvinella palmiformis]
MVILHSITHTHTHTHRYPATPNITHGTKITFRCLRTDSPKESEEMLKTILQTKHRRAAVKPLIQLSKIAPNRPSFWRRRHKGGDTQSLITDQRNSSHPRTQIENILLSRSF